ncbi:MAG: MFS transporter [Bacteroidales bacterium]|nr:MFS transporter [Bacteroidales bacterium]
MKKNYFTTVLPVLFGFFIMAFADLVGISTSYIEQEFSIPATMSSLISVACFIWFLFLSVPTGFLMNKVGRKNMVLSSFAVTLVGLLLPLVAGNSFALMVVAFAFLGIGNTIIQVAMNPLVSDVVTGEKLTGTITIGQALKAFCSVVSPFIAAAFVGTALGWKWIFPIYAIVTLISALWLFVSPIENNKALVEGKNDFFGAFKILSDKYILMFFIGILVLVGADVGMGITFPKVMKERFDFPVEKATTFNSIYYLSRALCAFIGGVLLMKIKEHKFYNVSIVVALVGLLLMIFAKSQGLVIASVILFGLGYANLFSIVFALAMKRLPEKANEVSALLVTGIAGGAIFPPIFGMVSKTSQTGAVIALAILWIYVIALAIPVAKVAKK